MLYFLQPFREKHSSRSLLQTQSAGRDVSSTHPCPPQPPHSSATSPADSKLETPLSRALLL